MLIIDTSTEKSFIATESTTRFFHKEERESIVLVPAIRDILPKKPSWIGVGLGPGSFTGTRAGVIAAKMLAFGYGVPLIGFCSLKAYRASGLYTVAFDAKARGAYLLDSDGDAPYLGTPKYPVISPHPSSLRTIEGATEADPDIDFLRSHLPTCEPTPPEQLTALYLGSI